MAKIISQLPSGGTLPKHNDLQGLNEDNYIHLTQLEKANLDNQSGINTGDETTSSIQTKRPLKTVDGKSLEGTGNIEIDYNTVINKPTSFPPSAHTHTVSEITDFPTFKTIENQSIVGAGNIDLNKSDVGLSNVDNTSDVNKPVSTAQQTALALKVDKYIKSNESLALSQRKGDVLYGILDQYTGEEMTLSKVTGTPSVDGIIYFQLGSEYFKRNSETYNVKWFGAKGDGITDDTSTIASAFLSYKNIYIPKGTWLVDYINILSNTVISTDGFLTIIKQKPQALEGKRILNINGSNVSVSDLSFIGNITTDIDEQNHAIFIDSNSINGNLSNIKIRNIHVTDIRGDGVYIGQSSSYFTNNISIGNVVVDNIYRNGVSIVSANNVNIESVTGDKVGYAIMDVESNIGSGVCTNIKVGYIKGRTFGLVAPTSTDYIDKVEIDRMDLDPSYNAQSIPSYSYGIAIEDGLLLRNVKSAKINHLKINGFNRCGIFTMTGVGELGAENIHIGSLYIRNCALTDVVYNTFLNLSNTNITVDFLDILISTSGKRGILSLSKGIFNNIKSNISADAILFYYCQNLDINNVNQIGDGCFSTSLTNSIIKNGNIICSYLASYAEKLSFENIIATASVSLFTSGYENHNISNCTLNGIYSPLQADKFVKFGGTSLQRLMADGSVNSDVYASTSATNGYIPKAISSSSFANSIIYETGGFIGIGKIDPICTLDVIKYGAPAINSERSGSWGQTLTVRREGTGLSAGLGIVSSGELGFYSNNSLVGSIKNSGEATFLSSVTASPATVDTQLATLGQVNLKEPIISPKNTAFNKNFGTTAGTVAEGNDSRFTDSRNPLPNSSNYIQNQNASAQSANMWISGVGVFGGDVAAGRFSLQGTNDLFFSNPFNNWSIKASDSENKLNFIDNQFGVTRMSFSSTTTTFSNTITASPATVDTQLATLGQAKAVARPYKVYTALLSQSGTNAPVATVLENTLGGTVVWGRNIAGDYSGTLTGAFVNNKTTINISSGINTSSYSRTCEVISSSEVKVYTYQGGVNTDGLMGNNYTSIEIRVYN